MRTFAATTLLFAFFLSFANATAEKSSSLGLEESLKAFRKEIVAAKRPVQPIRALPNPYDYSRVEPHRAQLLKFGKMAVPDLCRLMEDKDRRVVALTCALLVEIRKKIGADADAAVPHLIRGLTDRSLGVTALCYRSLMESPPEIEYLPALLKGLKSSDSGFGHGILEVIERMGDDAASELVRALAKAKDEHRIQIATTLSKLAPRSVDPLLKALEGSKDKHRYAILYSFWMAGPKAKDAVPAIVAEIKAGDPKTLLISIRAIRQIGPDGASAVPTLIERLTHKDKVIREWAIEALGSVGKKSASAVPKLLEVMKDLEGSNQKRAKEALWQIAPNDKRVLKAIGAKPPTARMCRVVSVRDSGMHLLSYVIQFKVEEGPDQGDVIECVVNPSHRIITAMKKALKPPPGPRKRGDVWNPKSLWEAWLDGNDDVARDLPRFRIKPGPVHRRWKSLASWSVEGQDASLKSQTR